MYHTTSGPGDLETICDMIKHLRSAIGRPTNHIFEFHPALDQSFPDLGHVISVLKQYVHRPRDVEIDCFHWVCLAERTEEDWLRDWQALADTETQHQLEDGERYGQ
jgi:hypothetical protein